MALFGFGKGNLEEESSRDIKRSSILNSLSDSNGENFEEISENPLSDNTPKVNTSNPEEELESNIKDKNLNSEIVETTNEIEQPTHEIKPSREKIKPDYFVPNAIEKDILEKAIEANIKEKISITSKEVNNKLIEKKEAEKYSVIMSLATSRPIEIAYDLSHRYEKEPTNRLDIYSKDSDLFSLVLKNPTMKYLDASDCQLITDFSIIGNLTELEELDLSGSQQLTDISFIKNLKKLRVLNLGITGINNIDNFPTLLNLQVLNLKMTKIKNLDPLKSCVNLHDLILWGCTILDNIDVVENFKELRNLDLDYCTLLKDINAIKDLEKLSHLILNYTKIEDLSPIKNLTNLQIFSMDFCTIALSEKNMSYFENLTKMKFLGLRNRVIRNLHYFRNMTQLVELEISGNAISDLRPLENMTQMQILNLSCNPSLTDLSPLYKMVNLKKLLLSGAKTGKEITIAMLIEDISIVKNFPKLEVCELNCNKKLRDISPLSYCPVLEEVYFDNCFSLADVTPLRFSTSLAELHVENCSQIRDLTFIKYLEKMDRLFISKTTFDRLYISDWTRLLLFSVFVDGDGTLPIHKAIINTLKFRKKISKLSKKTIKDEEN